MKDVMEVLRAREQELMRVKEEVEALRVAAPLLGEEEDLAVASPAGVPAKRAQRVTEFP
jgi:hypothetical protein